MAVRKIIRMGHPHLRRIADPVSDALIGSDELARLVSDMADTLHDYEGIGLAAPQIDENIRLAIIEIPGGRSRYGEIEAMPLTAFINPVITINDPAPTGYWEGCLSVPGLRGFVERAQDISVDFTDMTGQPKRLSLTGFWATVFQHEFDHLDGRLYIDRITDPTKLVFEQEFLRFWTETDSE